MMVRSLLSDRFSLMSHVETRQLPAYALTVAGNGPGPRLRRPDVACTLPPPAGTQLPSFDPAKPPLCGIYPGAGGVIAGGVTMSELANALSAMLERAVVDRTGLEGRFDARVEATPDFPRPHPFDGGSGDAQPSSDAPSFFTAIREQLGLKLDPTHAPIEVLVIDEVHRPMPN